MTRPRKALHIEVGERLRVTAAELGFCSAIRLSEHLGKERATVDAWFNGRSLPPVDVMRWFCEKQGLTLDWIYRGELAALRPRLAARLRAAMSREGKPQTSRMPVAERPAPLALRLNGAPPRKPVRRRARTGLGPAS